MLRSLSKSYMDPLQIAENCPHQSSFIILISSSFSILVSGTVSLRSGKIAFIDSGEARNSWQCVRLCGTYGFVARGGGAIYSEEKKIAIRNSWNVKKKEFDFFVFYSQRGGFLTRNLGQFIRT